MQLQAVLRGEPELVRSRRAAPRQRLDAEQGVELMQQAVAAIPPIPWHLDMRQHAHELATRFQRGVLAILPGRPRFHRKT